MRELLWEERLFQGDEELVFEQELGLFGNLVVRCSSFSCLDIPCFSLLYWCIIRCLGQVVKLKPQRLLISMKVLIMSCFLHNSFYAYLGL